MHRPPELHGLLAIDKPAGWTSHDVVARVRRLAGQREVGHGGTLDPMATGLLVLGLGQGTRVLEYLSAGTKHYQATVRFGAATDTYDAEGAITETAPWEHLTSEAVRDGLARFTGEIAQRPPLYSAIKLQGEALHRRARRGEQIEVAARPVTIYRLGLLSFAPPDIEIEVECGGGTYVRSLAHDLGHALGSAAHLAALRRSRVGLLSIDEAVTLEALISGGTELLTDVLLAIDRAVWPLPAVLLNITHERDVLQGRTCVFPANQVDLCRAYSADGRLLALLRYDADAAHWQPHKVFAAAAGGVS